MTTNTMTRPEPNVRVVRDEMRAHRERLKTAVHPGVTQREAGFTPAQRARLMDGVCDDLAPARGVWNGLKYSAVLWIVVLAVLLFGYALRGASTPTPASSQVVVR